MAKLSEINKALEIAVDAVGDKKAALEASKAQTAKCESDYATVVDQVRKLHAESQAIMKDILSFGGTVHAA